MVISRIKYIECNSEFRYILGIYLNLFHAIENAANQKRGKPLYFRQYCTKLVAEIKRSPIP